MTSASTNSPDRRWRTMQQVLHRGMLYLVLSAIGVTMLLPFLWMLSTSLKTGKGAAEIPPTWIPRQTTVFADYDGREVKVSLLKKTATVRRLDNGQEMTVYAQAIKTRRALFSEKETIYASLRQENVTVKVPVEVIATTARVCILEKGPDFERIVDLPGDQVIVKSKVDPQWSNYPTT